MEEVETLGAETGPGAGASALSSGTACCGKASPWVLDLDPLHLIEGNLVTGSVVEFGGAGGLVGGDGLGVFERSAIFEVGGDAGGPKRVAAHPLR